MALSGFALAGLYILALASQSWATIEVNMEDRVEVSLGQMAEIGCQYKMDSDPSTAIIQWFARLPGSNGNQERIFYKDSTREILDQDSPFAGRVTVENSLPGSVVLIVEPVKLEDELLFVCRVNTVSEGATEGSTQLRVFSKPEVPSIVEVHTGISVREKNPAKIATCEVKNGYPLPNITWYRNSTPLHFIKGEVGVINLVTRDTNNLYTVTSELHMTVKKEDKDASFYCESTYFMPGSTRMAESNRISITVYYPPTSVELRQLSPKEKVKEGDTVELRCYTDGNPTPLLTFKYNEGDLDSHLLTDDQQGVMLRDVKRWNGGTYSCSAVDFEGLDVLELEDTMNLTVHYLDEVVVMPKDPLVLSQGDFSEASCNALSSLDTNTVWLKNNLKITDGNTLRLSNVSVAIAGQYKCVVSVPALPELWRESSLKVFVQSQPQITDVTQGDWEDEENSMNVTCVAQGYPPPTITWSSPDVQDLDGLSYDTETLGGVVSIVTVKVTSVLTVICEAVNQLGQDKRELSVEPIDPETTPAPTTSPVVSETTTTLGSIQTSLFTMPGSVQTDIPSATETNQSSVVPETNVTAGPSTKSGGSVTVKPPRRVQKEGSGVIIAVLIICVLLLAILGSVLYFLFKKGKIPCGRSGKQDLTKQKSNKDAIIMEMKTDKSDEAVLLQGVNGEKKAP